MKESLEKVRVTIGNKTFKLTEDVANEPDMGRFAIVVIAAVLIAAFFLFGGSVWPFGFKLPFQERAAPQSGYHGQKSVFCSATQVARGLNDDQACIDEVRRGQ